MVHLFFVVILLLDIIAILDCIERPRAPGMKLSWIFLIILLPVIGPFLYFLVGRGKQTAR